MNVQLINQHICLDATIVEQVFGKEPLALMSYRSDHECLLLSNIDSSWFSKMHEASQCFLKTKNKNGDKSLPIHSLLMDYALPEEDRDLTYEVNEKANWIKILLT